MQTIYGNSTTWEDFRVTTVSDGDLVSVHVITPKGDVYMGDLEPVNPDDDPRVYYKWNRLFHRDNRSLNGSMRYIVEGRYNEPTFMVILLIAMAVHRLKS